MVGKKMNNDAYFIGNNCTYVKHYRSPIIMRTNYLKKAATCLSWQYGAKSDSNGSYFFGQLDR